jgi:RHS repeat-associated protein
MGSENFDVTMDLDTNNVVKNRRMYGAGFDEPIARQDANGVVTWYGADRLGSVRQVFDNSGAVTGSRSYAAFGAVTTTSGAGFDRYAFTGAGTDPLTGLVGDNARQYDPGLGRWTSEDPIGFAAGDANLSRYVGNGPTNRADPSGLAFWDYIVAVGEGIGEGAKNLAIGAGEMAVEVGQIGRDLFNTNTGGAFVLMIEMNIIPQSQIYTYDLHSKLFKGYDEAIKKQDGSGDLYTLNATADASSFGIKPLIEGIVDFAQTGDATQASKTCGGVAGSNLAGASFMKLTGPAGPTRSPGSGASGPATPPRAVTVTTPTEFGGLPRWLFDPVETPVPRGPAGPKPGAAATETCPAPASGAGRIPLPMAQEPIPLGPVRTVPGVQVNEGHLFHGEINRRGNAVGYHHRPGGQDAATARATVVDPPNAQGVYMGRVEVFDPATNTWVRKNSPRAYDSSFYPDAWSRDRVLLEVRGAYGARNVTRGNYWEGTSPSGVRIGGYLNPDGSINTAFPIP